MKYIIVVAILFCCYSTAMATFWRQCLGARPPDHIETPLCDHERCFATRGQNFYANITLSSPDVHTELLSENIVFILGIGIPLPMDPPHDNGCNALYRNNVLVGCPTVPNLPHVWRVSQPIDANLPTFQNAVVRYTIRDRGTLVGCVEFTATVV